MQVIALELLSYSEELKGLAQSLKWISSILGCRYIYGTIAIQANVYIVSPILPITVDRVTCVFSELTYSSEMDSVSLGSKLVLSPP